MTDIDAARTAYRLAEQEVQAAQTEYVWAWDEQRAAHKSIMDAAANYRSGNHGAFEYLETVTDYEYSAHGTADAIDRLQVALLELLRATNAYARLAEMDGTYAE